MQLSYQKKGNYTYAKVPDESYRENGRVKKRNAIYLGYFIDSLIRIMHYDGVLESISYQNKDTLLAMTEYYILSDKAISHANTWYDGSFANVLYPEADIHSQRISKFLDELGKEEIRRSRKHYRRINFIHHQNHPCRV